MILAVTGATGFVGSHLLDRALSEGHAVRALTRRPQPPRDGAVSPSPATAHMGVGVNGNGNGVLPSTNGYGAPEAFVHGFGGLNGLNGLDPGGADAASQPDHLLDSLLSQIGDGSVGAGAGMGTGASMDMTGGVGGVGGCALREAMRNGTRMMQELISAQSCCVASCSSQAAREVAASGITLSLP